MTLNSICILFRNCEIISPFLRFFSFLNANMHCYFMTLQSLPFVSSSATISLPASRGWGRSPESSLLSAHFNNSILTTKMSQVPCGLLALEDLEDHQFGEVAWGSCLPPAPGRVALGWGRSHLLTPNCSEEGKWKVGGAPLPGCETIVQQSH